MAALESTSTLIYGVHIRESANDGSDFSNAAADYRVLFLGEDGQLHAKDSSGTVTDVGTAGTTITYARKTSDQTTTSTSFADVSGLTFAVSASGVYRYRFIVFFTSSATTEGTGLSINGPTGTYRFGVYLPTAAPAAAGNALLTGSGGGADSGAAVTNAGPGASAQMAIVEGVVVVGGAGGTLALRVKTETGGANSSTVLTNSYGEITTIA